MKCPGCNEPNEAGMQFCIYCGYSFQAPVLPAPTVAQQMPTHDDMQARIMATSQTIVLICTVCSKTDPLQGQFCVFCGGRTITGAAPVAVPQAMNFGQASMNFGTASQMNLMTSQNASPEYRNMSEELPRVAIAPHKPATGAGALIAWVFLAILLGAASAVGTVFFMKEDVQKAALHSFWPPEGILVFSNTKDADVRVSDNKQKTLIFAKTSAKGTLYMPSIEPGAYILNIADGNGNKFEKDFNVNVGENYIIGYPNRLELKKAN